MTPPATGRVRFTGALLLAAGIALTLPASVLVLGPVVGRADAITLHWIVSVVAWTMWLAPTRRGAVGVGAFSLLAGVVLARALAVGHGHEGSAHAVLAAGVLAISRSVILQRVGWLRGLTSEGLVGVGAVVLAQWLSGPSLLSGMAGLWGFWLVQSLHPLLPGLAWRRAGGDGSDPFGHAASRLETLLEDA